MHPAASERLHDQLQPGALCNRHGSRADRLSGDPHFPALWHRWLRPRCRPKSAPPSSARSARRRRRHRSHHCEQCHRVVDRLDVGALANGKFVPNQCEGRISLRRPREPSDTIVYTYPTNNTSTLTSKACSTRDNIVRVGVNDRFLTGSRRASDREPPFSEGLKISCGAGEAVLATFPLRRPGPRILARGGQGASPRCRTAASVVFKRPCRPLAHHHNAIWSLFGCFREGRKERRLGAPKALGVSEPQGARADEGGRQNCRSAATRVSRRPGAARRSSRNSASAAHRRCRGARARPRATRHDAPAFRAAGDRAARSGLRKPPQNLGQTEGQPGGLARLRRSNASAACWSGGRASNRLIFGQYRGPGCWP